MQKGQSKHTREIFSELGGRYGISYPLIRPEYADGQFVPKLIQDELVTDLSIIYEHLYKKFSNYLDQAQAKKLSSPYYAGRADTGQLFSAIVALYQALEVGALAKESGSEQMAALLLDISQEFSNLAMLFMAKYGRDFSSLKSLPFFPSFDDPVFASFTKSKISSALESIELGVGIGRLLHKQTIPAPVCITYRDEAFGWGPFYDHFAFSGITGRETVVSLPPGMNISALVNASQQVGYSVPRIISPEEEDSALWVIPGRARSTPEKRPQIQAMRDEHEQKVINAAFNRGRVLLAVCGGLWQLTTTRDGGLVKVSGHTGPMPMPTKNNPVRVINNKVSHHMIIRLHSLAASLLSKPFEPFAVPASVGVNSVHWLAADRNQLPTGMIETGSAISHHGKPSPSVEMLESEFGAPQIGVQFHPEGFVSHDNVDEAEPHRRLMRRMGEAADTRVKHKQVVAEMELRKGKFTLRYAAQTPFHKHVTDEDEEIDFTNFD